MINSSLTQCSIDGAAHKANNDVLIAFCDEMMAAYAWLTLPYWCGVFEGRLRMAENERLPVLVRRITFCNPHLSVEVQTMEEALRYRNIAASALQEWWDDVPITVAQVCNWQGVLRALECSSLQPLGPMTLAWKMEEVQQCTRCGSPSHDEIRCSVRSSNVPCRACRVVGATVEHEIGDRKACPGTLLLEAYRRDLWRRALYEGQAGKGLYNRFAGVTFRSKWSLIVMGSTIWPSFSYVLSSDDGTALPLPRMMCEQRSLFLDLLLDRFVHRPRSLGHNTASSLSLIYR